MLLANHNRKIRQSRNVFDLGIPLARAENESVSQYRKLCLIQTARHEIRLRAFDSRQTLAMIGSGFVRQHFRVESLKAKLRRLTFGQRKALHRASRWENEELGEWV